MINYFCRKSSNSSVFILNMYIHLFNINLYRIVFGFELFMNVFRFILQRKNIALVRSTKFCRLSIVVDVKLQFKWSRFPSRKPKEIG